MSHKQLNARQIRQIELIKDYDCIIDYYPRKANVVVNVLSRKNKIMIISVLAEDKKELLELTKYEVQLSMRVWGSLQQN